MAVDLVTLHPADIYYFVEDDHLHLPRQKSFLAAGLKCLILSVFTIILINIRVDVIQGCSVRFLRHLLVISPLPSTVMTFACRSETLYRAREIMLDPSYG